MVKANNLAKLKEYLNGRVFEAPNGKSVTGEELLKIITKEDAVRTYSANYGSAEAKKETGEILLNTNNQYSSNSDATILKIIIHEALHCLYKDSKIPTWKEERLCESQALALTAEIVEEENRKSETTFTSYYEYGQNIENFSKNPQNQQLETPRR